MGAHASRSPSAADRWFACPGSVQAAAVITNRQSTEASAEGTVLHDVAATCLEFGLEPEDFLGKTLSADGFSFEITDERVDLIGDFLDWIREQPGAVYIERRVTTEKWQPTPDGEKQGGSLDIGIVTADLITIADWKFGIEPVPVVGTRQLRIYGLGFWDNIARHVSAATRFRFVILQPRVSRTPQIWEVDLDELLEFGEELRQRHLATYEPDAPRVAGAKQCRWCPLIREGGPGCATYEAFNLDLVSQKFADLDDDLALCAPPTLPKFTAITPERRAHIIDHADMFRKWLARLEEATLVDALAGRPTPGHKAVRGPDGDRKWIDESLAETMMVPVLAEESFNKKLKSPAQLEKVAKPGRKKPGHPDLWEGAQKLITRAEGRPILVSESDDRPALKTTDQKFSEIMETEEDNG